MRSRICGNEALMVSSLVMLKSCPSLRRFGETGQRSQSACDSANPQEQELQTLLTEEEQLVITTRLHQVLRPFVLRRMKESINLAIPEKARGCGRWWGRLREEIVPFWQPALKRPVPKSNPSSSPTAGVCGGVPLVRLPSSPHPIAGARPQNTRRWVAAGRRLRLL